MKRLELRDRWVVVTGASAGLGAAIARELAARGAKLVLVARRSERLEALARELPTEAVVLPIDLAQPGAAERLFEQATRGRRIHAVVLDAARYWFGRFDEMPARELDQLLAVNVHANVALVRRFLPHLDDAGEGGILVIASVGGLFPSPRQALYSASKALLVALVQNIRFERGPSPIVLSVAAPGGMLTEMLTTSPVLAHLQRNPVIMRAMMPPERVARRVLAAFERGELLAIPGLPNRALVAAARLFPLPLVGRVAARVYDMVGADEPATTAGMPDAMVG